MDDALTGQTVELLQQLIRNRCVNDGTLRSGQESRNSDTLKSYLDGSGLDIEVYQPPHAPGRRSLVARIEGSDPTAPTLCLMGHTDVVPVNPRAWTRDPFSPWIADGTKRDRIIGRRPAGSGPGGRAPAKAPVVGPHLAGTVLECSERDVHVEDPPSPDIQTIRDAEQALHEARSGHPELGAPVAESQEEGRRLAGGRWPALRRRMRDHGPELGHARQGDAPAVRRVGRPTEGTPGGPVLGSGGAVG